MSQFIRISGKKFELPKKNEIKWQFQQRPGGWILAESSDGIRKRILFSQLRSRISVHFAGNPWAGGTGEIQDEHLTISGSTDDSDLIAQFPGKVRKLLVAAGTEVQPGDPLVLIEAMKMEFSIKAPYSGKVTQILVQEGQQISPGDKFLEIEPKR